jgi:hypothetical protein
MALNDWFWIIYVICLLVGLWGYYGDANAPWYRRAGGHVAIWVLLGILGLRVFGSVVK